MKKTPLYPEHVRRGAKFLPFAGWDMPIEYAGILKEHEAVRNAMGIFDVSHMGEIEIKGKAALDFCQKISTNDASALKPGKVQYSTILNDRGGIIDDCTLYCLSPEHYLYVVNASRIDAVREWFAAHAIDGATIEDKSDEYGLIALQGKDAQKLLEKIVRRDLDTIRYYEFSWAEVQGFAALISRTGYTGEDGFEIYLPTAKVSEVWNALLEAGAPMGLVPVGLGARDTLRLEMGYLLYGSDMDENTTPLECNLGWVVKMNKGSFIGKSALLEQKEKGISRRLFALEMEGRGIPRAHYAVHAGWKKIGEVTSGTFSPTKKVGIALAYLDPSRKIGDTVDVMIRDKPVAARIVKTPFVQGSAKK